MLRKSLFAGVLVCTVALFVCAAVGDVRLADSAQQGDRDGVRSLLKQKVDVNAAQGDGMTALHWAAYRNDVEMVRMLIVAGANVKAVTRVDNLTALYMAATSGNAAMIDLLAKAGADVNAANGLGTTPLMQAAASGSLDAVRVLLDRGAKINAKESTREQTPLMFAAAMNRDAVVKLLAARGADLRAASKVVPVEKTAFDEDGNPLPSANTQSRTGNGQAALTVNPQAPGGASVQVVGGLTALHYAAREGQMEAVHALIEAGADVNQLSPGDKTSPMVMAIINGHFDVGKYLLDHGADPNLLNLDNLGALYATVECQWAPVAWTPTAATAAAGTSQQKISHVELLKALLEKGADPNVKLVRPLWFSPPHHDQQWIKSHGATAFWRAAQADDVPAMKVLLAYHADPKVVSLQNTSALAAAAGVGWAGNFSTTAPDAFLSSVKFLVEEVGLDVNEADLNGYTPLMGAAYRGDNAMVEYLVSKGAKLDARTKKGWSVSDMANAPSLRSSVPLAHPDTIAILGKMGAPGLTKVENEEILGAAKKEAITVRNRFPL